MEENSQAVNEPSYDSLVKTIKDILQYVPLRRLDDKSAWKYYQACKEIHKLIDIKEEFPEEITEEMMGEYFKKKYRGAFFIAMQVHATEMLYHKHKSKSHVAWLLGCHHATIIHRLHSYKKPYWYKEFISENFNRLITTNTYPKSFSTTREFNSERVGVTVFKEKDGL